MKQGMMRRYVALFIFGLLLGGMLFGITGARVQAAACLAPNTCQLPCEVGREETPGECISNGVPSGEKCCKIKAPASTKADIFNPLKFGTLDGVLTGILSTLQRIIVILSIIFIIIGALMYILSAGNDSRMTAAKGAIGAALLGLALALAAPAFLKELAVLLGWADVNNANAQVAGAQTLTQIAGKVLDFLLSIIGIIGIIMLVFGGFTYLTSAGDEGRAETGKKIVTAAVVAIALALAALALVTQVTKFFG